MLNNQVFVLHLFRNKGILYLANNKKKKSLFGFEWDDNDGLFEFLKKVKQEIGQKPVRILLDDQICYFLRLSVNSEFENDRQKILAKVSEHIPEELNEDDWDFKKVGQNRDKTEVVVFAPVKVFYEYFKEFARQLEIKINALEPVKAAEQRNKDPVLALAQKQDLFGPDKDVLNLPNDLIQESESGAAEKPSNIQADGLKANFGNNTFVLAMVIIGLILLAGGGLFFYFSQQNSSDIKSPAIDADDAVDLPLQVSPTPTAVPTINPNLDRAGVLIQVLNGSGVANLAGQVKITLENLGYKNVKIGNADSFDYQLSLIQVKEESKDYAWLLRKDLGKDYQFEPEDEILPDSSPYDLVVIIGAQN